jgi:hypothetical protein
MSRWKTEIGMISAHGNTHWNGRTGLSGIKKQFLVYIVAAPK